MKPQEIILYHQKHAHYTNNNKIMWIDNHWSLVSQLSMDTIPPIKRQTNRTNVKQDPSFCSIQETDRNIKDRHYLRIKGWKNTFQANGPKKQAGIAILISNKIDFQPKLIKKGREKHFILIKRKNPPKWHFNP